MRSQPARVLVFCALVLASLALPSQAVEAVLNLAGKQVTLGQQLRVASAGSARLPASRVYDFALEASVRGTGDLASLVPPGTSLTGLAATFGGSIPLSGRAQNETGRLPFAFIDRTMTRVFPITVPLGGTVNVRATLKARAAVQPNGTIQFSLVVDADPELSGLPGIGLGSLGKPKGAVVFEAGSKLTVETIFDPFAGEFVGLVDGTTFDAGLQGIAKIKVGLGGLMTGSLRFKGGTFAIKTGFDASLSTPAIALGKTGASARFTTSAANPNEVAVLVQHPEGGVATGILKRAPFLAGPPTIRAGAYTISLVPPPLGIGETASSRPVGNGYLTGTVTIGGSVVLAGKLCDGKPIACASVLLSDETFPFYAPVANGRGALVGTLAMQPESHPSDVDGALRWVKPATPAERLFKGAFDLSLAAEGSRYLKPLRGQRVLALTAGEIAFVGGGLGSPLIAPITLSQQNVFSVLAPIGAKVTAVTSKGLIQGSLKAGSNAPALPLRGVLLQKQNMAAGFFIGAGANPASGSVEIYTAAP